jgi:hypothetical protein
MMTKLLRALGASAASVMAPSSAPAPVLRTAPIPATSQKTTSAPPKLGITRATFYARRFGGGYRTARAQRSCEQFGCYKPIVPGELYFDTREPTRWPKTKCICAGCAETEV